MSNASLLMSNFLSSGVTCDISVTVALTPVGTSKEKEGTKKLEDAEKTGAETSSKKGKEKAKSKVGDSTPKDREGGQEYHASQHSIDKADRKKTTLMKQRERLSDPTAHKKFVEDWLNTRSGAQRPDFPKGIELVRLDPEYLPAAIAIDYHLSCLLLLNNTTNFLCISHVKLDRKIVSRVDNLEGPVRIWGTPLSQQQNPNLHSKINRPLHHFHCSCHEKVAIAGFMMWKTWKVKAMIKGQLVVEGLHEHKPFQPRDVLFILQFLKSKFGYTVEDMFTGSFDEEEKLRKEAQVMKKVANFCARRHFELIGEELTLDDSVSVQEEELESEWI
ncbi:hypothetical protein Agabi119p4_10706 [Agaricus bisporus var. burnettii]|uniref:Uncharacterized protein n=1 Tax=Agaricus bisporus var. burnettii TaxID=192524 RepID=A0A8H7C2I7_AGABI|nr:hypothetical protein Agabi119p4_10706 [Agaricus bisporus var. burnettii]